MQKITLSFIFCLLIFLTNSASALQNTNSQSDIHANDQYMISKYEGLLFSCAPDRIKHIQYGLEKYLLSLGINHTLYTEFVDQNTGIINLTLNTPRQDYNTLDFKTNPVYAIKDESVYLPGAKGKKLKVETVSRKEILLALMQHGRLTNFDGRNCSINALKDHIGIRQNIVAWAENLNWDWPDGEYAKWNSHYWHKGTPLPGVKITKAFADAFKHQNDYSIGCYTATKLVFVQGILDYYSRIHKNRKIEHLIEARLEQDHDPLTHIEPGRMWSFESDFDPQDMAQQGKLLKVQNDVAPKNFVPGDWAYLLNTDPISSQKTGYEGSNAIYLGRNKFDDYYDDNDHAYTYQQKLDEVYQWRNGVFSRSRDHDKIKPLTLQDFDKLSSPPKKGGLTIDVRAFPYLFAEGNLPTLDQQKLH